MTEEARVAKIESFIQKANELIEKPHNSPSIDLWKDDVERFLEDVYDEKLVDIFTSSFSRGVINYDDDDQEIHRENMQRSIELLEGLKLKQPPQAPQTTVERLIHLDKKYYGTKQTNPQKNLGTTIHYNISGGTVHTGNGDIQQNVTVKDIIVQVRDEIDKLSESPEKKSVLHALTTITTNPTFASVSGAFIGTIIGKIINPATH